MLVVRFVCCVLLLIIVKCVNIYRDQSIERIIRPYYFLVYSSKKFNLVKAFKQKELYNKSSNSHYNCQRLIEKQFRLSMCRVTAWN